MTSPRVRDLLMRGTARLREGGIETPALDAALLLGHLLGLDRAALYARMLDDVPSDLSAAFDALVARRLGHEPVAYLTGTKEFMGLPLTINAAVLVPRPETELLVEWGERWLGARQTRARVVDVGTGSGAIAVALASRVPHIRVVASDISLLALEVARDNARRYAVAGRVAFVRGDLLSWLGRSVDLILANLPYLTDAQAEASDLHMEPRAALAGEGADGFDLYRALIPQIALHLAPGGAFAFEIDPAQMVTAMTLCRESFPSASLAARHDLAGLARFVTVEMPAT